MTSAVHRVNENRSQMAINHPLPTAILNFRKNAMLRHRCHRCYFVAKGPGSNVSKAQHCILNGIKLWLHVQFLHARIAGNSKVMHAKIAHVTMALDIFTPRPENAAQVGLPSATRYASYSYVAYRLCNASLKLFISTN